jgi:Lhr-like helicase
VYVSPLKALSYDDDRNLRVPPRGIGADLRGRGGAKPIDVLNQRSPLCASRSA